MTLVSWDDRYSVKIKSLDEQHKKIFTLINNLHDAIRQENRVEVLNKVLIELHDYTISHFKDEEKYMKQFNYPDFVKHKSQHDEFQRKISEFRKSFDRGETKITSDLIKFLVDWLMHHINDLDKGYTNCFSENGLA